MPTQINPALQSDAITMVQKREDTNSLGLLMVENRDKASVTNTPKTPVLTPTTLQSITDLFQADDCLNKLETIERDGFVVPFPPQSQQPQSLQTLTTTNKSKKQSFFKLDTGNWTGGTTTVVTPTQTENLTILDKPRKVMLTRSSSRTRSTPTAAVSASVIVQPLTKTMKRQANVKRTPLAKNRPGVKSRHDESDLSPQEAERLRVRRERNKAAAARCRKRRMDQIDTLSEEVGRHEKKKRSLEEEIAQLKAAKEQLEYILAQHKTECKFAPTLANPEMMSGSLGIKNEPVLVEPMEQFNTIYNLNDQVSNLPAIQPSKLKPKRPLTLNVNAQVPVTSSVEGIVIETPSKVMACLGFDTLMASTGLTPTTNLITPVTFSSTTTSCSSQQRNSDSILPDLNTPSNETMSLVSL